MANSDSQIDKPRSFVSSVSVLRGCPSRWYDLGTPLKQIVRENIPPNAYFSEEEHVQMFSGACPRHITKAMLRAMLMPR